MGRNHGWIAAYAGLAGGADYILVPEEPIKMDEVFKTIEERIRKGKKFSLIVVSEGVKLPKSEKSQDDSGKHCGIGNEVAALISKKLGVETRSVNIGHILRGGSPSSYDRIMGTRFGILAVELILKGKFQQAVVLRGDKIAAIPFSKIRGEKKVNQEVYDAAKIFFH
jgi:6-phosphofructokinase 1